MCENVKMPSTHLPSGSNSKLIESGAVHSERISAVEEHILGIAINREESRLASTNI